MKIGLVPARAGSERIPAKNTRHFNGRPMLCWVLDTMQQSDLFDRIIVSTDCERIADIAREHNAETPFLRPAELADNQTGLLPVIRHCIDWLDRSGCQSTHLCCVLATAALLQAQTLRRAYATLIEQQCAFVISVARYHTPIQRALRVSDSNRIELLSPEFRQCRSQDLEPSYHDAGQFYWGSRTAFLQQDPLLSDSAAAVTLPAHLAVDIDTSEDWRHAELIHRALQLQKHD